MNPHPVLEMRSFCTDAYRCNFFGQDRANLLAHLSLRPWAGTLLRSFYPARPGETRCLYEIEWPRKAKNTGSVRVVYHYMGLLSETALPIWLLSARKDSSKIPASIIHRVAALGRVSHKCLLLQTTGV